MFWGDVKGSALSQALLSSLRLVFMPNTQQKTPLSRCSRSVCWWNESWMFPSPASDDFSFSSTLMNPIVPWNPSLGHILIYGKIFPHFCSQYGVSIKIIHCTVGTWYTLAVTIIKMSDMLVHTTILIVNRQWAGLSFLFLVFYSCCRVSKSILLILFFKDFIIGV